jgi:serine phosphatase RsbU (regulator of sigma subunit)
VNQIDPDTAAYELAESDLVTELRGQIAEAQRSLALSRQEVEHHRQLTSRVHRSLLPSPARHPRIDVDVRCLPMDTVGADYCQVHFFDASTCYVTMCDVADKILGQTALFRYGPPKDDVILVVAEIK